MGTLQGGIPLTGQHAGARAERGSLGAGVLALAFAVVFLVVFLAPPFTPYSLPGTDGLARWGDALDMLTPLVMLPAYWLVLAHARPSVPRWQTLTFLVLGALWIEGQSIHLAANSIGHLLTGGRADQLTSFYDEKLGHLMWHGAALALSAMLVFVGLRAWPASPRRGAQLLGVLAGIVYGFGFFLIAVEGTTSILAAAGAAVVTAIAWHRGRRALLERPLAAVFGVGYPVLLVLLAVWFAYWGGSLPEFSSLGLIK